MRDITDLVQEWTGIDLSNSQFTKLIIAIIIVGLLFYISRLISNKIIIPITNKLTKKTATEWDDIILNDKTVRTACDLVIAFALAAVIPFWFNEETLLETITTRICNVYITALIIKLICNILNSAYKISSEAEKTKNHTLQGVFQMLKILVISIGIIIITSIIIDKDPTKLLTGLGASAAVLMLVFKDSIMGLVAGVQLAANDMLRPGDWIEMPKYGADGFVIDVTLTTVKVQNWDKTITTIPPYALVSDSFQNWRGMFDSGGRRIKRSIYIDMTSIGFCDDKQLKQLVEKGYIKENIKNRSVNLTLFREWLEEWLRNHPQVNKDMIILVRQLQPTSQGLPLELYFFFDGTMWIPYEHLQAEIFEYIYALLPEFGLRTFQSPTGSDLKDFRQPDTK